MLLQARPKYRALSRPPEEVAAGLRHLPGFIWLDTAGRCPAGERDGAVSIMTARPSRILRGHLRETAPLEEALASLGNGRADVDWGVPLNGLFGSVDYDGHYRFGLYPEVIFYRHGTREWYETGNLLSHARSSGDPPVMESLAFTSGTRAEDYEAMVERAREYIRAGDIYQVNLAHRFEADWPERADPFAYYLRLREANPAPYAAWMAQEERLVLSSSPESFLRMSGNGIRTRPIKGTRPRFSDAVLDARSLQELMSSPKERAELVMITDLLRNDLGKVCEYGSVQVTGLLEPESYEHVHHLVSTVQGTLRPGVSQVQALASCFPGGSITGAPKRRSMEIIAELETGERGIYTGAIGFLGGNGESQFNIAIRTVTVSGGKASFWVGAGIVGDSEPVKEWEETLHKARGMMLAAGA